MEISIFIVKSLTLQFTNDLIFFLFLTALGGRDDAKVSIPATVVLRYMFTPAELRVWCLHLFFKFLCITVAASNTFLYKDVFVVLCACVLFRFSFQRHFQSS